MTIPGARVAKVLITKGRICTLCPSRRRMSPRTKKSIKRWKEIWMPVLKIWNFIILFVLFTLPLQAWDAQIYWDANDPAESVIGYNVYRSLTSGSGYVVISTVPAGPSPTYTDSGLSASTVFYVVTAVNVSDLESGFSNEVRGDEPGVPGPPSPPGGVKIIIIVP